MFDYLFQIAACTVATQLFRKVVQLQTRVRELEKLIGANDDVRQTGVAINAMTKRLCAQVEGVAADVKRHNGPMGARLNRVERDVEDLHVSDTHLRSSQAQLHYAIEKNDHRFSEVEDAVSDLVTAVLAHRAE